MCRWLGMIVLLWVAGSCGAVTLLQDDFSDGDYAGWTMFELSPTSDGPSVWSAASGALWQTSNIYTTSAERTVFTGTRAVAGDAGWTSYAVNVLLNAHDNDGMGVCFRLTDDTHYYRYYMMEDVLNLGPRRRLERRSGSTVTTLDSTLSLWTYPHGWFQVTIWADGDSLTVFEDGVPILGVRDNTYPAGKIGLDSYANAGSGFDNVRVTTEFDVDAAPIQLLNGPFLQDPQPDGIIIVWEANRSANGRLLYGLTTEYSDTAYSAGADPFNHITLTGLAAQTRYYYRLEVGDTFVAGSEYYFRTKIHDNAPWRLAAWSDNQTDSTVFDAVSAGMDSHAPDLAACSGDLVDDGTAYYQYHQQLFGPAYELFRHTPIWLVMGNHDLNYHWFYDYVVQPAPENYYAVSYGGCRLIFLDTNQPYTPGTAQYIWLSNELASSEAQSANFVFVFHHHPPWADGWGWPFYYYGEPDVRNYLVPLYEASGVVDMVICGHSHDYERGQVNGIYYVINGGGGGGLDHQVNNWASITVYAAVHEYIIMDINPVNVVYRAYDLAGNVIDSLFLGIPTGVEASPEFSIAPEMEVAPSPLRGHGEVTLMLPRSASGELAWYDLSGRRRSEIARATWSAGTTRAPLEATGLVPGVYWLKLTLDDGVSAMQRVVIAR